MSFLVALSPCALAGWGSKYEVSLLHQGFPESENLLTCVYLSRRFSPEAAFDMAFIGIFTERVPMYSKMLAGFSYRISARRRHLGFYCCNHIKYLICVLQFDTLVPC